MVCFDWQRGTVVERLMEETVMDKSHLLELMAVCECKTLCQEISLENGAKLKMTF